MLLINECEVCGNLIDVRAAANNVIVCRHCGAAYSVPRQTENAEVKVRLQIASTQMRNCHFDEAKESFLFAAEADPKEASAYFGAALAEFGVQYLPTEQEVDGNLIKKLVPISHRYTLDKSILADKNYLKALELATEEQNKLFKKEAEDIEYIRTQFFKHKKNGLYFDVFICVKVSELDNKNNKTQDSILAYKIYDMLKEKGYFPFYSEKSIGAKCTGADYEAMILYALHCSRCMVLVCFDKDYLDTPWVRNEYRRYISLMQDERKPEQSLVFVNDSEMIDRLSGIKGAIQSLNKNDGMNFVPGLMAFVNKNCKTLDGKAVAEIEFTKVQSGEVAAKAKRIEGAEINYAELGTVAVSQLTPDEEKKLTMADRYLGRGMFEDANIIYNAVINNNPRNQQAYWGRMLCSVEAKNENELSERISNFNAWDDFKLFISLSDKQSANAYVQRFMDATVKYTGIAKDNNSKKTVSAITREIIGYKAEGWDNFFIQMKKLAVESLNPDLLDLLLNYVNRSDVDEHIRLLKDFGCRVMDYNVKAAEKFFDRVLALDEGDETALLCKFKIKNKCGNSKTYDFTDKSDIRDYASFDKLLQFSTAAKAKKYISDLIKSLLQTLKEGSVGFSEQLKTVFDRVIAIKITDKKSGEEVVDNEFLSKSFLQMGNICLSYDKFDCAENYFALALNYSDKNYQAYWGMLKSKLRARDETDLVNSNFDISKLPEYESVFVCADDKFCDMVVDIRQKQKFQLPYTQAEKEKLLSDYKDIGFSNEELALLSKPYNQRDINKIRGAKQAIIDAEEAAKRAQIAKVKAEECARLAKEAERRKRISDSKYKRNNSNIKHMLVKLSILIIIALVIGVPIVAVKTNNTAKANNVIRLIDEIGTISATSKNVIEKAESSYNELSKKQKKLVANYEKLNDAKYEFMIVYSICLIDEIGNVSANSGDKITIAEEWYNGLDSSQIVSVNNYEILQNARYQYDVVYTIQLIDSIVVAGQSILNSKATIDTAQANYNKLTLEQKSLITNYDILANTIELYEKELFKSQVIMGFCDGRYTVISISKDITAAVIPDTFDGNTVTAIGAEAFRDCSALTSITIPNTVTYIGKEAFRDCTALTQINYNATNMGDSYSNNGIFRNAGSKAGGITVNIGANVTKIPAYLFNPNNTSDAVFAPKITNVVFANGSVCATIGNNTFEYCYLLSSINFPVSVSNIGNYSFSATALENISLSGNIAVGEGAFKDCKSLTSVILTGLTTISSYMFQYCSGLTSITIPDTTTSIGKEAFRDCTALTQINYNATNMGDSYSNNGIFRNAGSKAGGITVNIGANVTKIPAYLFNPNNTSDAVFAPKITNVVFANGSVCATIGNNTFEYCYLLSSINFPVSVSNIGNYSFSATALENISLSGNIAVGEGAFKDCKSLTSVILTGLTTISSYMFQYCSGLTSITIPDTTTSIGKEAFRDCTALTQINYNATNMGDSYSNNGIFRNAGSKAGGITVNIGANVTKIPAYLFNPNNTSDAVFAPKITNVVFANGSVCATIGNNTFEYCYLLSSINFPVSVSNIGNYSFSATALENISLSGNIAVGEGAFKDCKSLTSVILTGLTTISSYMFQYCSGLTSITIPDTTTSIGKEAFRDCTALTQINYNATNMGDSYSNNGIFRNAGSKAGGITVNIGANVTKIPAYLFNPNNTSDAVFAPKITNVVFANGSVCATIGNNTFEYISALVNFIIPVSVTAIGNNAFCNSINLTLYCYFDANKWIYGNTIGTKVTIGSSWNNGIVATKYYGEW